MKKVWFLIAILFLCAKGEAAMAKSDILVAYYSRTGNTEAIAKDIATYLKADTFVIVPAQPYPDDDRVAHEQVKKEIENNYIPPLTGKIPNLTDYKVVFIGSPIWFGHIAPSVKSFIDNADFNGKTVVPFCTHGGGGEGASQKDIELLTKGAKAAAIKCFHGAAADSSTQDVENWLKKLNLSGDKK